MKKHLTKQFLKIILSFFVIYLLSGCPLFPEYANASVEVIIPDFYRASDEEKMCKLEPEKTTVKLSYYDSRTKKYATHKTLKLSEATKTQFNGRIEVPDFPASCYSFDFDSIRDTTYSQDELRVELYDENDYKIDCYSNASEKKLNSLYVNCFTAFSNKKFPENQNYTLLPNEIRIHPHLFDRNKTYNFKINSDIAEVLLLWFDGGIQEHYSNSQISQNQTDFSEYVLGERLYFAVWNPSTEKTEYRIEFQEVAAGNN